MAKKIPTNSSSFNQLVKEFDIATADNKLSEYLYNYFFSSKIFNGKFLDYLVVNNPEQFIDALRKSQAFLRVRKMEQLLRFIDCRNSYVSNYVRVFKVLSKEEQRLYSEITDLLKEFSNTNPIAVLNVVSLWIERRRAEIFAFNNSDGIIYDITPEIESVNFFLTHYFRAVNTEAELINASTTSIADYSIKVLSSDFTKHPTWRILELIHKYLFYFLKGSIEIFSFDPNYVLNVSGNTATLSFKDLKLREKWNEEEAKIFYRYNTLKQRAEQKSLNELGLTEQILKDNPDPNVVLGFTSRVKYNLSIASTEDYFLTDSILGGVPTNTIIDFLNQNIIESYQSYVFPMDQKNAADPGRWLEHLVENIVELEDTGEGGCPVIILGQEMIEKVKDLYGLDLDTAKKLVDLISNDVNSYEYAYRFNPKINLLGKPFIKVGNTFIGLRPITGESVNHLSALINIMICNHDLHQIDGKKEIAVMERSLMKNFNEADFKNTDCSVEITENGKILGEFDLEVYEDGVLLIAEEKRSRPRVLPSEINNELINSLNLASEQLDERIKYIQDNFETFKTKYATKLNIKETSFSQLKIIPLILSTSLEQDHRFIRDKHLKVSTFELKEVLSSFNRDSNRNNLQFLYDIFLNNEFWKSKNLHYEKPVEDDRMLRFEL
jgi:hypothetical protein